MRKNVLWFLCCAAAALLVVGLFPVVFGPASPQLASSTISVSTETPKALQETRPLTPSTPVVPPPQAEERASAPPIVSDATSPPPQTAATTPTTAKSAASVALLGLTFPADSGWEVVKEPLDRAGRMKLVIKAGCTVQPRTRCPGFVVVSADWSPFARPEAGKSCEWNGVTDNRYYGSAKLAGEEHINGSAVAYEELRQCDPKKGILPKGDVMYLWRFVIDTDNEVVVYDTDTSNPKPSTGLVEYLKRVTF